MIISFNRFKAVGLLSYLEHKSVSVWFLSIQLKLLGFPFGHIWLTSTEDIETLKKLLFVLQVLNNLRVKKLWQNVQYWVNYPF